MTFTEVKAKLVNNLTHRLLHNAHKHVGTKREKQTHIGKWQKIYQSHITKCPDVPNANIYVTEALKKNLYKPGTV